MFITLKTSDNEDIVININQIKTIKSIHGGKWTRVDFNYNQSGGGGIVFSFPFTDFLNKINEKINEENNKKNNLLITFLEKIEEKIEENNNFYI